MERFGKREAAHPSVHEAATKPPGSVERPIDHPESNPLPPGSLERAAELTDDMDLIDKELVRLQRERATGKEVDKELIEELENARRDILTVKIETQTLPKYRKPGQKLMLDPGTMSAISRVRRSIEQAPTTRMNNGPVFDVQPTEIIRETEVPPSSLETNPPAPGALERAEQLEEDKTLIERELVRLQREQAAGLAVDPKLIETLDNARRDLLTVKIETLTQARHQTPDQKLDLDPETLQTIEMLREQVRTTETTLAQEQDRYDQAA